ncbi:MAG: rhodanese-like domain-containing protein [Chloroflexi bacterium]|nr:MAG: rhodanese-like domain-containing protein [Chloroflexota bacterium]
MKRQRWMQIAIFGVLALLLVATVSCGGGKPAQSVKAGPEPNFSTDSPYVSIDELKREFDRGARMIILDARPKQDYDMDHIAGAISMPFFEVEQRYNELPRDTWIVTYCACPRAEAQEAANILQQKGFTKVKVLYDGYFEWLARQYPTSKGES